MILTLTILVVIIQHSSAQCFSSCLDSVDATLKSQLQSVADQIVAKQTDGVDGVAWILDRTLRYRSHGPWESGEDSGTMIFQFQKDLAYIIGMMAYGTNSPDTTLTGKPYYLDWFSDKEAYSCGKYACMNPCQMGAALSELAIDYDDDDGRLEHGCGIASHYMDTITDVTGCTAPTNKMAVAIANSDVDGYFEHSRLSTSSTCVTKFSQRLGVGTHVCADHDCDLDEFSNAGVYKIPSSLANMQALSTLKGCMSTACCTGSLTTLSTANTECKHTNRRDKSGTSFYIGG